MADRRNAAVEALSVAPEPTADALRRRIGTTGLALGDGTARKFTASGAGDGGDAVCSSVEIWGADAVRVGLREGARDAQVEPSLVLLPHAVHAERVVVRVPPHLLAVASPDVARELAPRRVEELHRRAAHLRRRVG